MTNPTIFEHSVDVPSTGDFTTTPIFTLTSASSGERRGIFSDGCNGTVVFTDGKDSLLWGGDEYQLGRFINVTNGSSVNKDYTIALRNVLADAENRAIINKATNTTMIYYVGATRPLKGWKEYYDGVGTLNTSTGQRGVDYWSGSAWTGTSTLSSLSAITDNTVSANKPMTQTGTVVFDSTTGVSKPRVIDGICLHWYKMRGCTNLDSGSEMARLTVNAPMQPITDIWDG
jgi:hypothetical protein